VSTKNISLGIIAVIFLLGIVYAGVSAYIAYVLTIPVPSPVTYSKDKIGRGTDVVFKAADGKQLAGWYFPGINDKAIMFVHGAGNQNRANEVYGTPAIAKYFLEQGYTILLFDLRGTGESETARVSFGEYESLDVKGAFDYLVSQEYKPQSIGIIGDSLGAISTIMAADTVKQAGGIVLDSPATVMRPIVSYIMIDEHNVPGFLHPGIYFAAKALYNIDVDSVRPIDKISVLKDTPLLFLHGTDDTLIPPANSAELLAKVNNGKRILFPGAKHVETFNTNPELYKKVVSEFFENNLK
jgi:fermentation-respiration switch protein FrsA (DUF1100 family)